MKNFMIYIPHQISFVYSKENEACEAYCMNRELQWEILMDREHL